MVELFDRIRKFINYWYVRYLVVTELYMVESWERAVIHGMFAMMFLTFWYFNSNLVVKTIADVRAVPPNQHDVT